MGGRTTRLLFVGVTDISANTKTGKHKTFGQACNKRLH